MPSAFFLVSVFYYSGIVLFALHDDQPKKGMPGMRLSICNTDEIAPPNLSQDREAVYLTWLITKNPWVRLPFLLQRQFKSAAFRGRLFKNISATKFYKQI
jgi:hypothetical protein